MWSLTWGLGWVPALAALGGAVAIWWRRAALGWLLVPAPLLFLAFMGLQGRYFGRWLMPILPLLCVLAAFFVLQSAAWLAQLARRAPRGRLALAAAALLVALTLAQGIVYSVHSGVMLARADTRNIDAIVAARERAGAHEDRRRAGLAGRLGAQISGRGAARRQPVSVE